MNRRQKKDFMVVGGFCVAFVSLLFFARERPLTDQELGSKWCLMQDQNLDKAYPAKTARPPYFQGTFTSQIKLVIICKKKALH